MFICCLRRSYTTVILSVRYLPPGEHINMVWYGTACYSTVRYRYCNLYITKYTDAKGQRVDGRGQKLDGRGRRQTAEGRGKHMADNIWLMVEGTGHTYI